MTLYLKYRPQLISELDLTSVRKSLTNLITKDSLPHAFLFTGPRGTGKTSAARILAKAINCEHKKKGSIEPCNECESCRSISGGVNIDVVEMDAASNRGIDEIRALKQDIVLAPSISKKKVYIIDEVHMLTTEAANAFLKTLEEPPSHVVFILATTDPQKLPQTVVSRLSVVQFEKASIAEITKKLTHIVETEKFEVEEGVLEVIAKSADGSFRDAVKLLDELSQSGSLITKTEVEARFLGGSQNISELIVCLSKKDLKSAVSLLETISKNGVDGKSFLSLLISQVHLELLESVGVNSSSSPLFKTVDSVALLEYLLEAKSKLVSVSNGFLLLEIAFVKYCGGSPTGEEDTKKKELILPKEEVSLKTNQTPDKLVEPLKAGLDDVVWAKILFDLRNKNAGVEALLRASKPLSFDGAIFKIGVYFKFHKERLETQTCQLVFEEVLKENFGTQIKVVYELTDAPQKANGVVSQPSLTTPVSADIISAAKEIFGT